MTIKICFNNQIHKYKKLPENLQSLITLVTSLFKNDLPTSWTIQYLNSKGDYLTLAQEDDFHKLLETEASSPDLKLKLHIIPNKILINSDQNNSLNQSAGYSSLEKNEITQILPIIQQLELSSQNQLEKEAIVDNSLQQNIENQPKIACQSKEKSSQNENRMQFKKASRLIRLLAQGKHPEMIDQMASELNVIKDTLSAEQKEELDKKREIFEEKLKKKKQELLQKRARNQEKKAKNSFKIIKFVKTLIRLIKIQKEGDADKITKWNERLRTMIPENGRQTLASILASLPCDTDKETMNQILIDQTRKLVEECFPEGKDQILEELENQENLVKERKARRKDGGKEASNHLRKDKSELQEKYSKVVFKKATILKKIFIQEEVVKLCEYVSQKPEESSMEELVFNFRKEIIV